MRISPRQKTRDFYIIKGSCSYFYSRYYYNILPGRLVAHLLDYRFIKRIRGKNRVREDIIDYMVHLFHVIMVILMIVVLFNYKYFINNMRSVNKKEHNEPPVLSIKIYSEYLTVKGPVFLGIPQQLRLLKQQNISEKVIGYTLPLKKLFLEYKKGKNNTISCLCAHYTVRNYMAAISDDDMSKYRRIVYVPGSIINLKHIDGFHTGFEIRSPYITRTLRSYILGVRVCGYTISSSGLCDDFCRQRKCNNSSGNFLGSDYVLVNIFS